MVDSSARPTVTEHPAGSEGAHSAAPIAGAGSVPSRWRTLRDGVGAGAGALMGALPHVLHHVGFLAGAALVTGLAGNAVLFLVGMVLSIPLLRRLYRRFGTWAAPAVAVGVFAALFSFSALVLGPALTGSAGSESPVPSAPAPSAPAVSPSLPGGHDGHHSASNGETTS